MEEDDKNKATGKMISGSKKKRDEGSSETTTSAETSPKTRKMHPSCSCGGTFTPHIMNLNAGQVA
jgi:ribosomal protein S8E